jgi:hypothetical protein
VLGRASKASRPGPDISATNGASPQLTPGSPFGRRSGVCAMVLAPGACRCTRLRGAKAPSSRRTIVQLDATPAGDFPRQDRHLLRLAQAPPSASVRGEPGPEQARLPGHGSCTAVGRGRTPSEIPAVLGWRPGETCSSGLCS